MQTQNQAQEVETTWICSDAHTFAAALILPCKVWIIILHKL